MMTIIWLILIAVMLVIEIFTLGLTTIWFGIGAVAAAIASGLGAPLWLQVLLFCLISVLVMLLVRPFAMKVMNKERLKTNIEEILGLQGEVLERIDNQKEQGVVRLRGVEWMARSVDGNSIEEGELVTVESIVGVKLMVRK